MTSPTGSIGCAFRISVADFEGLVAATGDSSASATAMDGWSTGSGVVAERDGGSAVTRKNGNTRGGWVSSMPHGWLANDARNHQFVGWHDLGQAPPIANRVGLEDHKNHRLDKPHHQTPLFLGFGSF